MLLSQTVERRSGIKKSPQRSPLIFLVLKGDTYHQERWSVSTQWWRETKESAPRG